MNTKQLEAEPARDLPTQSHPWTPQTPPATADECCEMIAAGQPIAVHFWAKWDEHDRDVDRTLAAVAPRLEGWAEIYSCNIEEMANREWCSELDIYALPCVIVFAGGALRHRIVGVRDEMAMTRDILIGLTTDELQEAPWWKFW